MRRLTRTALSPPTLDRLGALTREVLAAPDPRQRAARCWASKPEDAFREVRGALERIAHGRARCMYCEDSLGTDIDHFWPKSDYPERAFNWTNYLLACSHCNSNLKRAEFPRDAAGQPLLLDPTVDDPATHLLFSPAKGEFEPLSARGSESIRVFGLNDNANPRRLPHGRRHAFLCLVSLLHEYDRVAPTDPGHASQIKTAMQEHPFGAVLVWLVAVAQLPAGPIVLGPTVVALVQRHGVADWV